VTLADFVRNLGIILYCLVSEIAHFGGVWPDVFLLLCVGHHMEQDGSI